MKYKYFGCQEYSRFYGKALYIYGKDMLALWKPQIIIPVPLHRRKQRIRGFNQAELLAKELSRYAGIPVDTAILKKCHATRSQKKLDAAERKKNLQKAFQVVGNPAGMRILLIDDVYTTGSTMDVLAKASAGKGSIPCIFSHAVYWKQQVKKCFSWHGIYDTIILYEYSFSALKETHKEPFMINEEKVKIMDRLAVYEKQEGRKYLPVSKYYRSDYIGLALIKNFFLVTIGYGLILAVIAAYNLEYLLDNVHKMDLISLGVVVLGGYIGILVLYSVLTYIQYTVKYHKAKKSVKQYYTQLTKLEKIYTREEKKFAGREMSGGYRK